MKQLDLQVKKRYRLVRRLGNGSFGMVYLATDLHNEEQVAIKLEHHSVDPPFLSEEAEIYKELAGGTGIPKVHWYGHECEFRAMVFELLGPSLEDLFNYCGRIFSLKTVLMLADQLIVRLQYIHSRNVVHQDIKPANFLMGMGINGNCVYATDLGLAAEYDPHRALNITQESRSRLLGTAHFASLNGHRGIRQSPRDDMESLGYMMLYLLQGRLPWNGLKAESTQEKVQLIMDMKENISLDDLCRDVPNEFKEYMSHVKRLEFAVKPSYPKLRGTFRNLFVRHGFQHDHVFDWTILKYMKSLEQQPHDERSNSEATVSSDDLDPMEE